MEQPAATGETEESARRHDAVMPLLCLSMTFSENRSPLFQVML
jgi:hypothetical protein